MVKRAAAISVSLLMVIILSAGRAKSEESVSVPGHVRYTGRILTAEVSAGVDVSGKLANVTFSLFPEMTGGVALWMETQNVQAGLNGDYTVLLGAASKEGIPQEAFASGDARWLEVSYTDVDGSAVTQPRVQLYSVPYALKAGDANTLGGLPASAFLLNSAGTSTARDGSAGNQSVSAAAAVVPVTGSGTTGKLPKWKDGPKGELEDSIISEVSGRIGLGTPAPAYQLDVHSADASLARFRSTGANNAQVIVETGAPGQQASILFNEAGVNKWAIGKQVTGDSLFMWDSTRGRDFFSVDQSGNVNIQPAGGSTFISPTAGSVGIGTFNPAAKLDVRGDASIRGNVEIIQGSLNVSGNTPGDVILSRNGSPFLYTLSGNLFLAGGNPANYLGRENTAIGWSTLGLHYAGNGITAVGYEALRSDTLGYNNTALGRRSLYSNLTGYNNTANGVNSLYSNESGFHNTAAGMNSLFSNTTGAHNSATGVNALTNNTTGSGNTASGEAAMYLNTAGQNNTAVGYLSGYASTTGSNSTFLGANAGPGAPGQFNNATAIGANAMVTASNALVLGSIAGVNGAASGVNVGVGVSAPTQKLHVDGGLRLATAAAKPVCNAASRGTFWITQGGAGVKDMVEVCAKDAGDALAWRTLY